jgi:ABC-2 type transport system ATP-binding protein
VSAAISVKNLKKNFARVTREPGLRASLRSLVRRRVESVPAVRGVSFDVAAGEKVAFIGPNGVGQSTTIKMLTGILHPTSGEASVLGLVPWTERKKLVARIGCVFEQRSQLWYHLPVLETFRLLAKVCDRGEADAAARLDELVDLFELEELLEQPVRKLSLGQRMRCEIAASLLHRPEAVFPDEPTIGLDVVARTRVRDLLLRLNEQDGTTLLLTSHDAGDIEEVCERVLLIDEGRVMLDTSVKQLKRKHLRVKRLDAVLQEDAAALELPGVETLPAERHHASFRVDTKVTPVDRVVAELVRGASVLDLTISARDRDRIVVRRRETMKKRRQPPPDWAWELHLDASAWPCSCSPATPRRGARRPSSC